MAAKRKLKKEANGKRISQQSSKKNKTDPDLNCRLRNGLNMVCNGISISQLSTIYWSHQAFFRYEVWTTNRRVFRYV